MTRYECTEMVDGRRAARELSREGRRIDALRLQCAEARWAGVDHLLGELLLSVEAVARRCTVLELGPIPRAAYTLHPTCNEMLHRHIHALGKLLLQ